MNRIITSLLLALSLVAQPAFAAADKPLVIISGQTKQLPAGDTLQVNASATGGASINIPHGTAPSAPVNGDCWTTTAGLYCRINGASVGPYSTGGGSGTVTSVDVSGGTTGLTTSGGPVTSSGTITLSGTVDVDNGGTGQTSFTNGQILIGNSIGNTLTKATLTAGSGVTITNGGGSITIASTGGTSLFTVRPPTTSLFSYSADASGSTSLINGGTYSYTYVRTDAGAVNADKLSFRGKAVPSGSSWTSTMGFWVPMYGRSSNFYCRLGLTLFESATNKSLTFVYDSNNQAPQLALYSWTNLTAFNAIIGSGVPVYTGRFYLLQRVSYNGTTYTFDLSWDWGDTWTTFGTAAKATYFTTAADKVGVSLENFQTGTLANQCRAEVTYFSDPDF